MILAMMAGNKGALRGLLVALLLLLVGASQAAAERVVELLTAVAANARFDPPARADVRLQSGPDAASQAILLGRGEAVYLEVKDGLRAIIRPGDIRVAGGSRPSATATGQQLSGTPLLLEDLTVFVPTLLKAPMISDDGPTGVVVTSAPTAPSAYALVVHTIAREHHTIVKTLYYQNSVSNLAKIRRDAAFVQVGGDWRPGEIRVDDVRQGTTARLVLTWRDAPDMPEALFEAASLEKPSRLSWPARP